MNEAIRQSEYLDPEPQIVASELKDPIWHSSEWQIGSFSSVATKCASKLIHYLLIWFCVWLHLLLLSEKWNRIGEKSWKNHGLYMYIIIFNMVQLLIERSFVPAVGNYIDCHLLLINSSNAAI